MMLLKEALNTHMKILGLDAEFAYHRQLNALDRVGKAELPLDLDALRRQAKGKSP